MLAKTFICLCLISSGMVQAACDTFTAVSGGGTAANNAFSLGLESDGTVWAWGENASGQLGNGTMADSAFRVQVQDLSNITAIAAGGQHALALRNDGTVWAWGNNGNGQLGNGLQSNSSVPLQVLALDNVKAISAGGAFSLALKNDGSVWAWGLNTAGQLGDGTLIMRLTPVQVDASSLGAASAIAAGGTHSLAIRADTSKVFAWGAGGNGQLGIGASPATDTTPSPVVAPLGTEKAIAAGEMHSLAIQSDGVAFAWGLNSSGQLGNGLPANSNIPVAVIPGNIGINFQAIAAVGNSSYALKNDFTVWAWGSNTNGQLGNGNVANSNVPVAVNNTNLQSSVTAIEAGFGHALALKSDGSIWDWGSNASGQLGTGITGLDSFVPVPVALTPFTIATPATDTICSGATTSIVLTSNLPLATFSWTVVQNGVSGASDGSGDLIAQTLTLDPGAQTGTAVYTIRAAVGTCIDTPLKVTITVEPLPIATASPSVQTICSGETTNITLSSNIPGTTFTIAAAIISPVLGASQTITNGNLIQQTLFAVDNLTGTIIYTIIPRAPNAGCSGEPISVKVIVQPCGPTSPSHFCAKVSKKECNKQTQINHVLTWKPSTDPTVDHYDIAVQANSTSTRETIRVPATGPFKVSLRNRSPNLTYSYILTAVNSNGNTSRPLEIVVPKGTKQGKKFCTDNCQQHKKSRRSHSSSR